MLKQLKFLFVLLAVGLLLSGSAAAQDETASAQNEYAKFWQNFNKSKWHEFDFSKKKLTETQIKAVAKLTEQEQNYSFDKLALLRGVVFGKRGRIFKERSIQDYLEKQAWYKPNPNYRNATLTAFERQNLDLIRLAEAAAHDYIQPGDMRLWQNKPIPEDKITAGTAAEWRILIAEIEAIHGKTFAEEPWLQKYFEERYWYKANPAYSPAVLNKIEEQNIAALNTKRDADRKVALGVGDMDKFQDVELTESMLEGLTINELRTMRNEVWARRGLKFKAIGVQAQFAWQDWYKPAKNQAAVKLSETETKNVDTLLRVENRLREDLVKKPITIEFLGDMFTEDLRVLRNEIYARRGRIFKSKDLNDYFKEQKWYKPDPNYNDNLLSQIESDNLKVIAEAEKNAISKFVEIEG